MLLFLTTNIAAVTSSANQQYLLPNNVFWYPGYQRLSMRTFRPRSSLSSDARENFFSRSFAARDFGLRPKICPSAADTEAQSRSQDENL